MVRWTYGKEGEHLPVREGELWCVGNARIRCADLLERGWWYWYGADVGRRVPDVCVVDPPWGAGVMRAYRTKAGKTDMADAVWYEALIAEVAAVCVGARNFVLETGVRQRTDVSAELTIAGRRSDRRGARALHHVRAGTYGSGRPCVYLTDLAGLAEGVRDEDMPVVAIRLALGSTGDGLVVDPCTGRGLAARAALAAGHAFYGTEMHPNRVSAALSRLHADGHGDPWRV